MKAISVLVTGALVTGPTANEQDCADMCWENERPLIGNIKRDMGGISVMVRSPNATAVFFLR